MKKPDPLVFSVVVWAGTPLPNPECKSTSFRDQRAWPVDTPGGRDYAEREESATFVYEWRGRGLAGTGDAVEPKNPGSGDILGQASFPAQAIHGLYLDRAEAENRVAAEWMSLTLKTTLLCPRHTAALRGDVPSFPSFFSGWAHTGDVAGLTPKKFLTAK